MSVTLKWCPWCDLPCYWGRGVCFYCGQWSDELQTWTEISAEDINVMRDILKAEEARNLRIERERRHQTGKGGGSVFTAGHNSFDTAARRGKKRRWCHWETRTSGSRSSHCPATDGEDDQATATSAGQHGNQGVWTDVDLENSEPDEPEPER